MNIVKAIRRFDSTPTTNIKRKHIPWFDSPIEDDDAGNNGPSTTSSRALITRPDSPRFKHYDEDHTIELVYDMFLVAVLSTFTAIHGIEDGPSLQNLVAFFTILWWTWLQTVMFDVRFGVDSIYDRVFKAITLCITMGLMLGGSVWDITKVQENKKGFKLTAAALMVSRFQLFIQYGVVAFCARGYKRTFLPLVLTSATMFLSAVGFMALFFVIQHSTAESVHIGFYPIIAVEGFFMLVVPSVWRVLSFKDTRFIVRMGDASMIMLGEGAVGLAVSVSKIMANSASISNSIGVTISAVLLIYFTWMLYYDQIDTNRFGTIRQQIWAAVHFPLNLAMVFILEGMRELVAYNTINGVYRLWWSTEPDYFFFDEAQIEETGSFAAAYDTTQWNSSAQMVDTLKQNIKTVEATLGNTKDFEKKYNATQAFEFFESYFNTTVWNETQPLGLYEAALLSPLIEAVYQGVTRAIYEHFGVTPPDTKDVAGVNSTNFVQEGMTPEEAAQVPASLISFLSTATIGEHSDKKYQELFLTIFWYFPLGAAFFLLILAAMYWFSKRNMSKYEWGSIGLRITGGVLMIVYCILMYYVDEEWLFSDSPWVVPVVTLTFFAVIVGDNLIIAWGNKVYDEQEKRRYDEPAKTTYQGYENVSSAHGESQEIKYEAVRPGLVTGRTVGSTDSSDMEMVKFGGR